MPVTGRMCGFATTLTERTCGFIIPCPVGGTVLGVGGYTPTDLGAGDIFCFRNEPTKLLGEPIREGERRSLTITVGGFDNSIFMMVLLLEGE